MVKSYVFALFCFVFCFSRKRSKQSPVLENKTKQNKKMFENVDARPVALSGKHLNMPESQPQDSD